MNETRHDKLTSFVNEGYQLELKLNKISKTVKIVVTNPNNCELPKYDFKGRFKRISFYDSKEKKSWDYSTYELIAYMLDLDFKLNWTKNNRDRILKPALLNYIDGY